MSKLQVKNGQIVLATQKQVEKYENKVLNGYLKSPWNRRTGIRVASRPYIGRWADTATKCAHKLARLAMGVRSSRSVK